MRFICKRPYRRAVESDGNVGYVRKLTGSRRLPRDEAKLIMLKEEGPIPVTNAYRADHNGTAAHSPESQARPCFE